MSPYIRKGFQRCSACGRRDHRAGSPRCPERDGERPDPVPAQATVVSMQTPQPAEYLNRSAILARGWTQRLVARHLGPADAYAPNPHHPAGASMGLYLTARVLAAEALPAFAAELAAVAARRARRGEGAHVA